CSLAPPSWDLRSSDTPPLGSTPSSSPAMRSCPLTPTPYSHPQRPRSPVWAPSTTPRWIGATWPRKDKAMGESWSGAGLVFGFVFFIAAFSPSMLPRRWLGQGLACGLSAWAGYLLGFLLECLMRALLRALGFRVEIERDPSGATALLLGVGAVIVIAL